jgi:hypothetical protein
MKVALCISGQPRGLETSLEHVIKNVIEPNNIEDIFIHTWYHPDWDNVPFNSSQPAHEDGRLGKWQSNTDKIILSHLNPKKYIFEKPNSFEKYKNHSGPSSAVQTSIISQLYGVWKANELKKEYEQQEGFKYDVVIRARFDLYYFEPFVLSSHINKENINSGIFTSRKFQGVREHDSYNTSTGETYSSMTDKFIFGSSENMDKVCDMYPNFDELYDILYPLNYGECYMGYQVRKKHNFHVNMIDFNFDLLYRI